MTFEFKKYFQLIFNKELEEAINYRKKSMPKRLYKYVSLTNNIECYKDRNQCKNFVDINEKKFNALRKNQIWMSKFDNLNDPYEYKAMFLKRTELAEKGWPIELLDGYINRMKEIYLISSFTQNIVDNMPMWAHYSNNHQGFCVEYNVLNPKVVYPISYEEDRFGLASIITTIFDLSNKIFKGEIDETNKEFQWYMTLITHFGLIKHKSWAYENEFRIIQADQGGNNKGALVPTIKVGLDINAIFIGSQCSNENRDELIKIAQDLKVNIYEMYLDDEEPNYKLSYRLI
jgi:hypothetical protein